MMNKFISDDRIVVKCIQTTSEIKRNLPIFKKLSYGYGLLFPTLQSCLFFKDRTRVIYTAQHKGKIIAWGLKCKDIKKIFNGEKSDRQFMVFVSPKWRGKGIGKELIYRAYKNSRNHRLFLYEASYSIAKYLKLKVYFVY